MAIIRMAGPSGNLAPTVLTSDLDVTGWMRTFGINADGADSGYFVDPPGGGHGLSQLRFTGNDWSQNGTRYSGTINAINFSNGHPNHQVAQFAIEGLSISLAAFLANPGDILELALAGNDIAYGTNSANTIYAGAGNDRIFGYGGNDILRGEAGNDAIYGGAGDDWLYGGDGNDRLFGANGVDTLNGDAGNDYLDGGAGDDVISGGDGADTVIGGLGRDIMFGADSLGSLDRHNDTIDYGGSNAGIVLDLINGVGSGGYAEGDRLSGFEIVKGSAFADTIYGSQKNEQLFGQGGDDILFGGGGHDKLLGDAGNDYLNGGAGSDQLYGGAGNDYIEGGAGNDVIWGDDGDDVMVGGAGNDYIVLGPGSDGIYLGAGRDLVRFDFDNGQDTIFDFKSGEDRIDLTWTDVTLADVQGCAHDTVNGVVFDYEGGSVLMAGVKLADLNWNVDFLFA